MINIGFCLERVKPEFYEICSTNKVVITEPNDDPAELTCFFTDHTDKEYIRLLKEHNDLLQYSANRKCADGIIIESDKRDRSKARIYIFELKTGMGNKTWEKVKQQFCGATLRALAFASSIGVNQILSISYFTAYVDAEELNRAAETARIQEGITGTIARKRKTGVNQQELKEWQTGSLKVFDEQQESFSHQHILLRHDSEQNIGSIMI